MIHINKWQKKNTGDATKVTVIGAADFDGLCRFLLCPSSCVLFIFYW